MYLLTSFSNSSKEVLIMTLAHEDLVYVYVMHMTIIV